MFVTLEKDLYFLHRSPNTPNELAIAPFQMVPRVSDITKVNRYTAQSPLLPEEPSGFFANYSETLPSSA